MDNFYNLISKDFEYFKKLRIFQKKMKIIIYALYVQIGINSVYCTYIGYFFTSSYDKLNEEMKEIRTVEPLYPNTSVFRTPRILNTILVRRASLASCYMESNL